MSRQHRSREEWQGLVGEFERGGQTRQEFAAERGVNFRSLENWYYRFRREQRGRIGRPPAIQFVAVKVRGAGLATAASVTPQIKTSDVIEARVGAMRLRFHPGVDSDYMGRLLVALSRGVGC